MGESVQSVCEEARRLWAGQGLSAFAAENRERFLLVCKSLRKYCVGDADAASVVQEYYIYPLVGDICKSVYMRKLFLGEEHLSFVIDDDDFKEIILVLCQFCANFINCGDVCRRYVWSSPESIEVLKHILAVCTYLKHPKALVAAIACIYNSLQNSLENTEKLLQCRDLACQMLLAVIDCEVIILNSNTAVTAALPEEHPQLLEWYYLLIKLFTKKQLLNKLYHILAPTVDSAVITHEQIVLLQIVAEVVDGASHQSIVSSILETDADECDLALFLLTLGKNVTLLNILDVNIDQSIMNNKLIAPKLLLEALPLHLDIISSIFVMLPIELSNPMKVNLLLKTKVLDVCLYLTNNLSKSKSRDASAVDESSNDILQLCLQVIGNLVYRCKVGQDMIRNTGGLPIIMQRCTTDLKNPLVREWALLCLRNCCEGNSENQQYIDSINIVQDVVQDEELLAKGITVSIDKGSGKINFNKKDT